MDTGLKQRLIGAAVLVALAVIFLPMLVKGPAPDSGVSDVSLKMPDAPDGDVETRELPLVMPGELPKGGAVGMDATPVDRPSATAPTAAADPTAAASDPAAPVDPDAPVTSPAAAPLPPSVAGGDYAVHFGAYASQKGAETVVGLAKAAGLPAYSEAATVNGKPAFRVRIGPYATRAEAEIVRVKALEVRSDVPVRVIALDAEPAPVVPAPTVAPGEPAKPVATAKPAETRPVETKPAETRPEAKPQPKPASAKPAEAKPVAAKPAETKPAPTPAKPPAPKPATPPAAAKVGFAVQVGAFGDATEAGAMREKMRAAGFTAFTETVDTDKGKLTRVRVGPVLDRAAADQLKSQIQAKTGIDGIVRPHP